MAYDFKTIESKFNEVPKDIQQAILSFDLLEKIEAIGKKYKLKTDDIGNLAEEVGAVMLGITRPQDFVSKIKSRIDKENAEKIVIDLNKEVFSQIRESLKKVHKMGEEKEVHQTAPESEEKPTSDQNRENIFDQKMRGMFVNKAEKTVDENQTKSQDRPKMTNDPYREAVE